MRFALRALLLVLGCASAANAASLEHFPGTSAPAGFTSVTSGNGQMCMNATAVAGSGGSCTAATSGEDWLETSTPGATTDAAFVYRTAPVSFSESRIYWLTVRGATAGGWYFWLNEGVPVAGTNAATFGATGKALLRITSQNSGLNIGVDRYANDASRTRTQWNAGTNAWAAPTVNAATITLTTYTKVGIEIDGPNRRWRAHVVGQTGTAQTPDASLYQTTLTDWVLFSFHEGGTVFCNPTCGTTYLAWGEPLTDAVQATAFAELYEEHDGTKIPMWSNGRNAGGTWAIHQNHGYADANGVPRFVPTDRAAVLSVGGAATWDEQQVKDPYVIQDGANFIMMYGGSNAAGKFQVGCASASSADGPWTKCPNNPMAALSAGTSQDQTLNPTLVKDEAEPDANKRWKMIYVGADTASPIKFRVFIRTCAQPPTNAACDTAAEWSAATQIVDVGSASAIDEMGWGRVLPMRLGATLYLFGGVRNIVAAAPENRQESYATTSDRWLTSGAITKSGTVTNPSLVAASRTATTAAVTTASRTLTVSATAGFSRDDMIVVDDDATSGNYYVSRVLRVASSTSLVLYHELNGTVSNIASGAVVTRPNGFQQIDVGPIGTYAGGYWKIAT